MYLFEIAPHVELMINYVFILLIQSRTRITKQNFNANYLWHVMSPRVFAILGQTLVIYTFGLIYFPQNYNVRVQLRNENFVILSQNRRVSKSLPY